MANGNDTTGPVRPGAPSAAPSTAHKDDPALFVPHTYDQSQVSQCPYLCARNSGDAAALVKVAQDILSSPVMFGDQSLDKARLSLESAVSVDNKNPKTLLMLAQVDFRMERWGDAANALEACLANKPDSGTSKAAQALLLSAKERIGSRVDVRAGPTVDEFSKTDTTDAPIQVPISVPQGTPQATYVSPRASMKQLFGRVQAEASKLTSDVATKVAEMADHYQPIVNGLAAELAAKTQAHPDEAHKFAADFVGRTALAVNKLALTDGVWTNWDKDPKIQGLLKMSIQREWLLQHAIKSTYAPGEKTPYSGRQVSTAEAEFKRFADGSNNVPGDPGRGKSGTRFLSLGPDAIERIDRTQDKTLPNVEDLQQVFMKSTGARTQAAFLNGLGGEWIQPQIHDWEGLFGSAPKDAVDYIPLSPLAQDMKDKYGVTALPIPRTPIDPTQKNGQLTQLNEHTAWWDGSELYGDNAQTIQRLRAGADGKPLPSGKLRMDVDAKGSPRLPLNPKTGVEDTGVAENWWLNLDAFHTLFVEHHNYICDVLEKSHGKGTPDNWTSDQIFEKARLINAALMAKVHTTEWTPAILPNETSVAAMNTNWFGLEQTFKLPYKDRRVVREGKPDDPVVGGIVGNSWTDDKMMYNFSREFAIVYRVLHNALPDNVEVTKIGDAAPSESIPMENVRGADARKVAERLGMETVFNSMGNQHANALVLHNMPKWAGDTSTAGASILDLGATDLYRARETGVLPYNEFRRKLGLKPIRTFDDLTNDADTLAKLRKMYCVDASTGKPIPESQAVEKLDLEIGALAELYRPKDFIFGETIFQVFIVHASRRLASDPWYTQRFDAQHYTPEGLGMVERSAGPDGKSWPSTMKDMLLQHYPALKKSGLMNVDNAFEPWGTTAWSNREEHPLFWSENYGLSESAFIPVADKTTGQKYVVDVDAGNVLSAQTGEGTVDVNHVFKGADAQAILDAAQGKVSGKFAVGPKFGGEAATVLRHGAPCGLDGTVSKEVKDWEPAWMKPGLKIPHTPPVFVQKIEDRLKNAFDLNPVKDPSPVSSTPADEVKAWPGSAQWKRSVPPRTQDAELATRVKDLMPKLQAAFKPANGETARAQHRKGTYATAQATFTRSPSLPKELQVGAFGQDKLRAIVRLSNVDGSAQSDEKADLRGIAIRFTDDKGHVQDLLMNTSVNFMAKDANEAIIGAAARGEGAEPLLAATLKGVEGTKNGLSPEDTLRLVKDGTAVKTSGISLAATSFWSRTYFQLGDKLVKLRLVPADDKVDPTPRVTGDDSLTQDLASRLSDGPVRYKLQVQGYLDDKKTPLNDERLVWDSPWVTVGELDLPKSNTPPDATAAAIEKNIQGAKALTFSLANRWDQSSGSLDPQWDEINRLRLAAYPASQDGRGADRAKGGRCPYGFDG